jgi:hypothetical protein
MKERWVVCAVLAAFLVSMTPSATAGEGDKIVRTKALNGLPIVTAACKLLGCTVLLSLDTPPDEPAQPSSLFLVRGLVENTLTLLLSLLGLAAVEPDLAVTLVANDWDNDQASAHVMDQLQDQAPATYYGTPAWRSYLLQPANDIIRLRRAHCSLLATGAGIVAVIDTGVDRDHPTLQSVLTAGYDFTTNSFGGSETWDSGQASAHVMDGSDTSSDTEVNQASAHVMDDSDHRAFGHGTMVAGVVHLAAPTARIMPLKAFGSDGQGHTSDILRAVYYATRKGAKVLNMSFSRGTSSPELKLALSYATGRGLIAVASAGNEGKSSPRYPAAYDNVIGVASTSNEDVRSTFSNYGSRVWMAAPGEGIITTYPGGGFTAAWGTSFSTPYVAGTAALLADLNGGAKQSEVAWAVAQAKLLTSELGYGRLDVYRAVKAGRSMWPWADASAVPESCDSDKVDWTVH